MFKFLKKFHKQDDGAVTVDWVVLTAAIVGLAVGLIGIISSGATHKSTSVGALLSSREISSY